MKKGIWRTVGGRRIFIKDGQDLETAMAESGKFDNIINRNRLKRELKDFKMDLDSYLNSDNQDLTREEITLKFKEKYHIGIFNDSRLPNEFNGKNVYIENHVISHILSKHKNEKTLDYLKNIDKFINNNDEIIVKEKTVNMFKFLGNERCIETFIQKKNDILVFHFLYTNSKGSKKKLKKL